MATMTFDKATVNGLSPRTNLPNNTQYCRTMKNLQASERGGIALAAPTYPVTDGHAHVHDFPFPQMFRGERNNVMLFEADEIYTVDSDLEATQVTTYDGYTGTAECVTNGGFGSGTGWTLGSGWSIGAGVLTGATVAAGVAASQLVADQALALVVGQTYEVTFTVVTRSAGSVCVKLGTAAGTTRSATGTYTERITCAGTTTLAIAAVAEFSGTIDNVSVIAIDVPKAITEAGVWHTAFFQDMWFATNGTGLAFRIPSNLNNRSVIAQTAALTVSSLCAMDQRLVLGGLGGTGLAGARWTEIYEAWLKSPHGPDDHRENLVTSVEDFSTGFSDWVMISRRGGGALDYPFLPFIAALGIPDDDAYEKYREAILTEIDDGHLILFRLNHTGAIKTVLPIGDDGVVVYGERGVSLLRVRGAACNETPLQGCDVGVPGRGCATGSLREHRWFGSDGELYRLPAGSGAAECLYYGHHLTALEPEDVVALHDEREGYWWFTDGVYCFCQSPTGMSESAAVIPTAILRLSGNTALLGAADVAAGAQAVSVITETFDGGHIGVAQVRGVRLETTDTDATGWAAAIGWKVRKGDAEAVTTPVAADLRGVARIAQSGREFTVQLAAADRTKVDLRRFEVEMSGYSEAKPSLATLIGS